MGKQWKRCQTLFFGLQNHCRWCLCGRCTGVQSSLSGKESAQGCIPKRLLGRPDEPQGLFPFPLLIKPFPGCPNPLCISCFSPRLSLDLHDSPGLSALAFLSWALLSFPQHINSPSALYGLEDCDLQSRLCWWISARSWEALGEAHPGQSSLSAGALRPR